MPVNIDQSRFDEFTPLELLARQVVEGFITGLHKSPFHGFSVEFAEHRLYNQGESVRHIDWKLFGRTDRLYVKRFEEETNLRCQLVIDASSSMYFPLNRQANPENPDKISFSVFAAAALLHLLRRQRDAAGLTIFTNKIELHTGAHSNQVHVKRLYTELEKLINTKDAHSGQTTSAAATLHQIAENIHKRSLVVIFSDMLDSDLTGNEVFQALQHLKHNKHEVILFHVADKNLEIDFAFENKPYRFVDMETGQEIKIRPHELREGYQSRMKAFTEELNLRCAQYHIDLVKADINLGFRQILLPYLLKRVKMH
ncbi:MAG: DUF58 domain-containing protein [Lentimicrobiaceae bacterium]|nr:DUF58 domain-containing protein [Lentimicrobiaceae bacterium]